MWFVVFEGVDGSGKSTLEREVARARNFEDLHVHRSTPSQYAYGKLYGRSVDKLALYQFELGVLTGCSVLLVVLTCAPKVLVERRPEIKLSELLEAQVLIAEYALKRCQWRNQLWLSTDEISLQECAEQVVARLRGGTVSESI